MPAVPEKKLVPTFDTKPMTLPPGFITSYKKILGPLPNDAEVGLEKLVREIEHDKEAAVMLPPELAYMIATVWGETKRKFAPVVGAGDLYRKRGYVPSAMQGEEVYKRISAAVSTTDPEVLLGPGAWMAGESLFAYKILSRGMREGLFTGKKLSDFHRPDGSYNFVGARAIVNGKDKAKEIAAHAEGVLELIVKGKEKVA
jgi:hypothetical protein